MADQLKQVRFFGVGGVNVDKDPLDLTDQELQRAQNATFTNLSARQSALVKRPGLQKFNTLSLGATVMGGIEAPYQNTAGAPVAGGGGGGLPGDSGGAASGGGGTSLGPGDTITTGVGSTGTTSAAASLTNNGSTTLFGGSPLILIGRFETSGADSTTLARSGWYLTTEGLLNSAYRLNSNDGSSGAIDTPFGPPGYNPEANEASLATGVISLGQGSSCRTKGQKLFTIANGNLYYPEQINNQLTDLISVTGVPNALTFPSIRRMSSDGTQDARIITLPDNLRLALNDGTGVKARISYITSMLTQWGNGDAMFVAVVDAVSATGTTVSSRLGRILMVTGLDGGAYTVTEIFNSLDYVSLNQNYVPYTLANFMGNLWIGSYIGNTTGTGGGFNMYTPMSGSPNGWGLTHASSVGSGNLSDITCMQEYSGALYLGTINRNGTPESAQLFRYGSDTNFSSVLTGTGGTLGSKNFFCAMEVFQGNLYASYYNGGTGVTIYKYDGNVWTGVYTASGATGGVALNLKAYDSYLYAWGGSGITATTERFIATTNGTSWIDQSTNLTPGASGSFGNLQTSACIPVLFKITQ